MSIKNIKKLLAIFIIFLFLFSFMSFFINIIPVYATDEITNGGFETGDFTGWDGYPYFPYYQSIVDTEQHSGTYSCKMEGLGGIEQELSIDTSEPLSFTLWVKKCLVEIEFDLKARVGWYYEEGGGEFIETEIENDTWTLIDHTDVIDEDKTVSRIRFISSGTHRDANYIFWDDVSFTSGYSLQLPFDNETSTTAYDYSGSDNDGAITGADRTYDGHFGMALDFDGMDYITVVDDDTLDLTSTITLSAYIRPSTVSGEQIIFDKPNAYGLYLFDDAIGMMINNEYFNTSTNVINTNTWYHIVGEYNSTSVNIYLDEVLIDTEEYSEVISVSAFDLILGDAYTGILDEMIITTGYTSDLLDPIVDYPYVYNGYVDTTGCSWIVSTLTYNFTGVFIRQNSTYPITYAKINFTDNVDELGLSYTVSTTTFDCIGDEDDIEKIYLVSRSWTSSYNAYTLQGRIRIEEYIQSYSDVDLMLYCETSDSNDSLTIEDRFSVYGIGGITTTIIVGDGSLIAGGSMFDIMAQNSSETGEGSSIRVDTVIPNFQHIHVLTHLYQSAIWDTDHWDCPTDDAETGYLEYGVNYWICADDEWIEGWKVRIEVLDGDAGDHGGGSDMAWVLLNVTWWNAGDFVKYDTIYAFYEAYHEDDTTTQFSLYIDLWISSDEFSSNVAGHVSSQYYGMEESGWWLWANWGPKNALSTSSTFYDNLYDSDGNITTASKLKMFQVWTKIAKTDPGEGDPSCDSHLWASQNEVLQIKQLPYNIELTGILPPMFQPTTTPSQPVGFFASLGNLLSQALDAIYYGIVTLVQGAYTLTASVLDSVFGIFGISGFTGTVTDFITNLATYFITSITYISTMIISLFTLFAGIGLFIIEWFGRVVTTIVTISGYIVSIFNGTYNSLEGVTPIIDYITEFLAEDGVMTFIPFVMIIYWFNSIDDRAKRLGGGWMSIFMGDIQSIMSVLSFILDLSWRVVNTIIDLSMRFINIFMPL